jgi:RHS repeat-associated protein
VKRVVGGQTTVYVGAHFEKNVTTGEVTKSYTLGDRRVAMRRGSTLTYLHGDHLGSASMTTNALGGAGNQMRYYPYGDTRSGSMSTDRRFTGQREETAIGLYDYNARYYDPVLGRFIQADTIVPEPGNPQALNRYAYVMNSPLNLVDPTGHDPLGPEWRRDFWRAHNRRPTDLDRQYRLFSLAYRGPVSGKKAWTAEDWAFLGSNHNEVYENLDKRGDLENFTAAIDRVSSHYSEGEEAQFVSGLALLYAGWPYDPTGGNILDMFPSFNPIETPGRYFPDHGMSGFAAHIQNGENTHHYAGHLLLGYHWGRIANVYATNYREVLQWTLGMLPTHKPPNDTYQDIRMGWIGGRHGRKLKTGRVKIGQFWQLVYRDLKVK